MCTLSSWPAQPWHCYSGAQEAAVAKRHDKGCVDRQFQEGEQVLIQDFPGHTSRNEGVILGCTSWSEVIPGRTSQSEGVVQTSTGSLSYTIELTDGRLVCCHIDHICQAKQSLSGTMTAWMPWYLDSLDAMVPNSEITPWKWHLIQTW